jgi:Tfp pilus assembly protein PilV
MILRLAQAEGSARRAGFSLVEVLIAFLLFGMTVSGLIYGYVQANRMAEFSSMSLAAQSLAEQGMEQARSAQWDSQQYPVTNGPGTSDEISLYPSNSCPTGYTNYFQTNSLDVPSTGALIWTTNYITITNMPINGNVLLRQIRSDVVWTLPLNGKKYTNTVITQRAPDE